MRDVYVRVTWMTPGHNFEAIDKYQVKLLQSDGVTYTEQVGYCDGSDANIFSQLYCEVPLSILSEEPY